MKIVHKQPFFPCLLFFLFFFYFFSFLFLFFDYDIQKMSFRQQGFSVTHIVYTVWFPISCGERWWREASPAVRGLCAPGGRSGTSACAAPPSGSRSETRGITRWWKTPLVSSQQREGKKINSKIITTTTNTQTCIVVPQYMVLTISWINH